MPDASRPSSKRSRPEAGAAGRSASLRPRRAAVAVVIAIAPTRRASVMPPRLSQTRPVARENVSRGMALEIGTAGTESGPRDHPGARREGAGSGAPVASGSHPTAAACERRYPTPLREALETALPLPPWVAGAVCSGWRALGGAAGLSFPGPCHDDGSAHWASSMGPRMCAATHSSASQGLFECPSCSYWLSPCSCCSAAALPSAGSTATYPVRRRSACPARICGQAVVCCSPQRAQLPVVSSMARPWPPRRGGGVARASL
jgi:hypothetical protein